MRWYCAMIAASSTGPFTGASSIVCFNASATSPSMPLQCSFDTSSS